MRQRDFAGEVGPVAATLVLMRIGVGYEHVVAFFRTRKHADAARSRLAAKHSAVRYEVRAMTERAEV